MNNKILYGVIVVLLVVVVGGAAYFMGRGTGPTGVQNQPMPGVPANTAEVATLSEQPNQAKYNEYLSDIYLGKMPIGTKIGTDGFPTRTNIFTSKADLFCSMMNLKKTIVSGQVATAIYDTVAKSDNVSKTIFPMELKAGGSGGCSNLSQGPGKYEYKLYIDDVLAAVLPFEVR